MKDKAKHEKDVGEGQHFWTFLLYPIIVSAFCISSYCLLKPFWIIKRCNQDGSALEKFVCLNTVPRSWSRLGQRNSQSAWGLARAGTVNWEIARWIWSEGCCLDVTTTARKQTQAIKWGSGHSCGIQEIHTIRADDSAPDEGWILSAPAKRSTTVKFPYKSRNQIVRSVSYPASICSRTSS